MSVRQVTDYNGASWEVLRISGPLLWPLRSIQLLAGNRSMHFFAIGDWGGLLGTGLARLGKLTRG